MATIYRRCGCRRPDGTRYPVLAERATAAQRASTCPRLARDPKHGSWGYFVNGPIDPQTGRRQKLRRAGFALKREAVEASAVAASTVTAEGISPHVVEQRSLASWMDEWLERRTREGLRSATLAAYSRYIRKDIAPALGALNLTEIRRRDVDAFLHGLLRAGRGVVTVHRIHAVISSAFATAVRLDLVPVNPATGVELPRESTKKLQVWEPNQVVRFLDAAAATRLGPLYEVVVRTGLRRGEVAGLRWGDIDLEARRLIVRQQRVQVDSVVVLNHAKTEHGQDRRVTLDATTVAQLLAWRGVQDADRHAWGSSYQESGWVFTYEDGRPLEPHYISKTFRKIVRAIDLPHLTFHGLRHEHASLLLSAGVPITAVSKRLGHSSAAITSDLYSHLLEDADRRMADAIETVLGGP